MYITHCISRRTSHSTPEAKAVDARVQTAQRIGKQVRQHRYAILSEIHCRRALACFVIKCRSMSDVHDT
jgi:hypothetical protein